MSALPGGDWPAALDLPADAVPIHHLGAGCQVVRDVTRSGRPKVITEGGVGVAVIVDAQTYEALRLGKAARDLARDLEQAIAAADAGELVDHEVVMAELRERYAGKVPPAVLREFDEA